MRIKFASLSILFMSLLVSCGYLNSGEWEDDNKNWTRAYNQPLPDTIHLLHSFYWRSPHWTLEQALYFEVENNNGIKKNFIQDLNVVKLDSKDTNSIHFFYKKPIWFIPKPYKNYIIWKGNRDDFDNFILFQDKENGNLYWTDYQL